MAVGMPVTWTVTAMAPADLVSSDCPGNVLAKNRGPKIRQPQQNQRDECHGLHVALVGMLNASLLVQCSPQICTPDLVVFLACANQRLKERLLRRAEQQGRPDDNLKATQRRLMNFKQNAAPLGNHFQEKGLIMTVSELEFACLVQERSFRFL